MQILKDEIREKIKKNSLKIFAEKGYSKTTISDVSEAAGISVGNIYNYFPAKKDLFREIIPLSVIEKIKQILQQKFIQKEKDESGISAKLINIIIEYRYEFIIIMSMADGTEYGYIREDFIRHLVRLYRIYIKTSHKQEINDKKLLGLIETIYSNLVDSIIYICRTAMTSGEVSRLLNSLLAYHVAGIYKLAVAG